MKNQTQKMISVSELFSKSLAIYKTVFWKIMKMLLFPMLFGGIPLLFIIIFYAIGSILLPDGSIVRGILNILLGFLGIISTIIILIAFYISQIGIMVIVQKNDPSLKIKEAFKIARSRALKYFLTSLLTAVIIFAGMILLIVPGIILATYYIFTDWIIVDRNFSGIKALKESKALVKGYWWAVIGRVLLPTIVIWALVIPVYIFDKGSFTQILYSYIMQIFSFVTAPFFVAYHYHMYKSLVNIKG